MPDQNFQDRIGKIKADHSQKFAAEAEDAMHRTEPRVAFYRTDIFEPSRRGWL